MVPFLSALWAHLVEKSPIKYFLTRNARCFIPNLLIEASETSKKRFNILLAALYTSLQMPGKMVKEAKREFTKIMVWQPIKKNFWDLIWLWKSLFRCFLLQVFGRKIRQQDNNTLFLVKNKKAPKSQWNQERKLIREWVTELKGENVWLPVLSVNSVVKFLPYNSKRKWR